MSLVRQRITFKDYEHKYDDYVTLRREDGILEVTLHDRDSRHKSIVWGIMPHGELSYLFYDISRDYQNECVILTGAGDEFIGAETTLGKPIAPLQWDEVYHNCKHIQMNLLNIEVPVIAAVNGPALVHAELALLSDIVLASETADFQDSPHFLDNLVPGDSVQFVFQMLLGPNRGRYFMLTGEKITAQRAYELGLVNEVLPREKLLERAWYWARFITARSKLVVRYTRDVLTREYKRQMLEHISSGIALEGLGAAVSWGMHNEHTKPNIPGHPDKL